jgi:hypothetical protein
MRAELSEITIEEALDFRVSQSSEPRKQITRLAHADWGKPMCPHKGGGETAAHVEHSERNAACRLSDTKRAKSH